MGSYDLIVFDWDGTLFDSVTPIFNLVRDARRDRPATEIGSLLKSSKLLPVLEHMMNGRSTIQISDLRIVLSLGGFEKILKGATLYQGMKNLILALHARGQKMAVVSGRTQTEVMAEMRQLGIDHCFFFIMGVDQAPSKPNPAMLHAMMSLSQSRPERTVMVGDSTLDLEMAMLARVSAIAVAYKYPENNYDDIERLSAWRPVKIIHSVAELSSVLLGETVRSD